jgi:hypothetical protein
LFVEERRRLKIIPNAFGEREADVWHSSVLPSVGVLSKSPSSNVGTAVRKQLDHEYEATLGLNPKPAKDEAQVRISSNSRT